MPGRRVQLHSLLFETEPRFEKRALLKQFCVQQIKPPEETLFLEIRVVGLENMPGITRADSFDQTVGPQDVAPGSRAQGRRHFCGGKQREGSAQKCPAENAEDAVSSNLRAKFKITNKK